MKVASLRTPWLGLATILAFAVACGSSDVTDTPVTSGGDDDGNDGGTGQTPGQSGDDDDDSTTKKPDSGSPDAGSTTTPALVVTAATGPATDEEGGAVTFTVRLASKPGGTVKVPVSSTLITEAKVLPTELVFTDDSWDAPQTVTVTGVDDGVADGDRPYEVHVGPATAPGTGYDGVDSAPIALVNQDNETPGFFVSAAAGEVTEAGGSATFNVRLRSQPTANVEVEVASDNPAEGTVSTSLLVFTPEDFNLPHPVTVTGVDDLYDDGNVGFTVTLAPSVSTDATYNGVDPIDVTLTNKDNDSAGLVVADQSGVQTNEAGGTVTFTVRLAAIPKGTVTVPVTVTDATEAQISGGSSLVFDTGTWDAPQTVTVKGLPDTTADGDQAYDVKIGPSTSAEAAFTNLTAGPIHLVNKDNPLPNYAHFDINHILSTGQSNATANGGSKDDAEASIIFTSTQPYTNIMFNTGVFTATGCGGNGCTGYATPTSFVPLIENDKFFNYQVETISSYMANRITKRALDTYYPGTGFASHNVLVSQHGRSGFNYVCLRRNGCGYQGAPPTYVGSFEEGMKQVDSAIALAAAANKTYAVRAVTLIHGEDDHYSYGGLYPTTPASQWSRLDGQGKLVTYTDALLEFQREYDTLARAKTGQTQEIPLFLIQMQAWTNISSSPYPASTSPIPPQQYMAHKLAPGKVVLVAPGYMMKFRADCLHYTGIGQRRLGEYFAKAYAKHVFEGSRWEPTGPKSISRVGAVVTVKYHVPTPPLVLDTTNVTNPGNYGFRYLTGGAQGTAQTISSVVVSAPDTITITLAATPAGGDEVLQYANYVSPRPSCPGPTQGARGNVRDSDPTASETGGLPLYNWGVGFEFGVPWADP